MQHTRMGCGSDLPTILGNFKNEPTSRSVNICFQRPNLDPHSVQVVFSIKNSTQIGLLISTLASTSEALARH